MTHNPECGLDCVSAGAVRKRTDVDADAALIRKFQEVAMLRDAAVEMYEALKRCESRMAKHPMWYSEDAGPCMTLRMVQDAIAKAEGRDR